MVYCGRTKQAGISSLSSLLRNDIKHINNVDLKPPPGNGVDNGSNKILSYPNCTVLREITPCKNQSRSWVRVYLCYYSESAQLDPVQSNCTFQQKIAESWLAWTVSKWAWTIKNWQILQWRKFFAKLGIIKTDKILSLPIKVFGNEI